MNIITLINVIIAHMKINGSRRLCLITLLFLSFVSCSRKNYFIESYLNDSYLCNDKLNVKVKIFGDIEPIRNRKQIKKILKQKSSQKIKLDSLLFFGETTCDPNYYLMINVNYDKLKLNDALDFEKRLDNNFFSISIIPKDSLNQKNKISFSSDGNQIKESLTNLQLNDISLEAIDVVLKNYNSTNYLKIINELDRVKLKSDSSNYFSKKQYELTYKSFLNNYLDFHKTLNHLEKKKINSLEANIEELIKLNKIILDEDEIYKKIDSIAKNERLIIINESHWKPNHRIFLNNVLPILKNNGFNILAVEAITNPNLGLNRKFVNDLNAGFYTRESHFQNALATATKNNFQIIGYDFGEGNQRDIYPLPIFSQILSDPKNKLIIYVGFDHVLEENKNRKWLAQNIKEQLNINPVTINQTALISNKIKLGLINADSIDNNFVKKGVDFFLINNLDYNIKGQDVFITTNAKSENVLIQFFNFESYNDNYEFNIPIYSFVEKANNGILKLKVPKGKYFVKVLKDDDTKLFSEIINVE